MSLADFLLLSAQFGLLSLLSIGGYATVLPDAQRYLVGQRGWLDEASFAQAVALGQVAPGPNILIFGVLGWMAAGWPGLIACLGGILLPSTLLVWQAGRWARKNREHAMLIAFQTGSAPLVLGLTLASGGLLAVVALGSALRPRWPPLLWLALGAAAGGLGLL